MVFARIGLLGTLLMGMRKRSPSARKTTTPGSEGSEREESAVLSKRELKGRRKNLSKNRSGSFNADQTPAQLRKRIAERDLGLRELERNRFDYDHKDRWCQKAVGGVEQEDAMPDNFSKRGQSDRSKIAMNDAFEVRYWTKHLGVSEEELQRVVDKVGNSAAAVKKELEK
ncbi:hypothetical protein V1279_000882 [Bradyrhizobium sp. AZCC 1610]